MVPRTVLMKQEISSIIGPEYEAVLGNVIGPQGFGWSNMYSQWFLNGPQTLGSPTMFSFYVHHYNSGQPYFAQRPVRKHYSLGSFIHPVEDSPVVPPIANLSESYVGPTSISSQTFNSPSK